jgi:hypothetical protein
VPLAREKTQLIPVLISEYSGDWEGGLTRRAYEAIWSTLNKTERARLKVSDHVPASAIDVELVGRILHDAATVLGRKVLLIFDQFDDYQLTHRAQFLDERRTWIPAAALKAANAFGRVVDEARVAGDATLMFVVRSDACSGLHSVRFTESNAARPVLRLNATWLPRLLNQVSSDDGKGPVIENPEDGWTDLKRLVELDLNRGGTILPQQVRVTLLGLRELGALTPGDYRRMGRAAGAEALYIRDAIRSAAAASGLAEREIRAVLLKLIERGPANTVKTRQRSDAEISQLIPDDAARRKALERLERDEIVREGQDEVAADARWQLDHDYLAVAVAGEERVANRFAVLLRDGADAWERAGSDWYQRYQTLLPVRTQLALVWARIVARDPFSYRPYRRYAALSLLRFAPLLLITGGAVGWTAWTGSASYQIQRMVELGPKVKASLGDDGAPEWADALALSGRSKEALLQARAAGAAQVKAKMLAQIAGRLAERGESDQAVAILRESMSTVKDAPENSRSDAFQAMLNATTKLARSGASKQALQVLQAMRTEGLGVVPMGNNRVFVALQMAKLYRKLSHAADAHALLVEMLPQIAKDKYNIADSAIEFHRLGDNQHATELASALSSQVKTRSSRRGAEALGLAALADAYRELSKPNDSAASLQSAIDSAMAIPGVNTRNASEAREYVAYFEFSDAAQFCRSLVRGGRSDAVPAIALREGDITVRIDALVAAAEEAFRTGKAADVDRFMRLADGQARSETNPLQRARALMSVAAGFERIGNAASSKTGLLDAEAAANGIQEAYVSTDRFDGVMYKLSVMIDLARQFAEVGLLAESRSALRQAEALSRKTTEDPSYYLPGLANALAGDGQLESARRVAEQVRDGDTQLKAFAAALRGFSIYSDPALKRRIEADAKSAEAEL